MDDIRKNLEKLCAERDVSMRELSLALKKNETYFHQFVKLGRPKKLDGDVRKRICAYLGVDESVLGGLPKGHPLMPFDGSMVSIIGFEDAASAGHGLDVNADGDFYVSLPRGLFEAMVPNYTANNLMIVSVQGDSMTPTLQDGQYVFVDTTDTGGRDGVYVFTDQDGTKIKRLQFAGGRVKVKSDNQSYDAYDIDQDAVFVIHGRVIRTLGDQIR